MGTEINAWGGKIRWLAGETVSERVDILDATLLAIFLPTTGAPTGPFGVEASVNKEGDFQGVVEDATPTAISLIVTLETWHGLDDSLPEVIVHWHIYFVAAVGPVADYEGRYRAKRV